VQEEEAQDSFRVAMTQFYQAWIAAQEAAAQDSLAEPARRVAMVHLLIWT